MAIFEFLSLLNNLDIKIWIEDGQLRFRAPKGAMTDELKQQIKERKAEIIAFLHINYAACKVKNNTTKNEGNNSRRVMTFMHVGPPLLQ